MPTLISEVIYLGVQSMNCPAQFGLAQSIMFSTPELTSPKPFIHLFLAANTGLPSVESLAIGRTDISGKAYHSKEC